MQYVLDLKNESYFMSQCEDRCQLGEESCSKFYEDTFMS